MRVMIVQRLVTLYLLPPKLRVSGSERAMPDTLLIFMPSPPPPSGPAREAQPRPGAGRRAVTRAILQPAESEMLQGAGGAYPVANFGVSRVKPLARQRLQGGRILLAQRADDLAVERLVDGEMAQPARRHDADAKFSRIALDGFANRLPEPVAAPRRRLVGRVIGVENDRDHGNRRVVQ